MTDSPNDLIAWLRAVLDEDERVAHTMAEPMDELARNGIESVSYPAVLDFLDHFTAGRMLVEVESKRGLLVHIHNELVDDLTTWERGSVPGEMLRLLAAPYADRPGYRDEWRP